MYKKPLGMVLSGIQRMAITGIHPIAALLVGAGFAAAAAAAR